MSDPVDDLSEGQKKCLRLVAQGMSSKEIAKETGLSPPTVDTYLRQAMAKLGASSRREAARIVREREQSQNLISQSPAIAEPPQDREPMASTGKGGGRRWWRLPPVGGSFNDLSGSEKSLEALRVAIVGAVTVLALSLIIAGLFQIIR